MAEEKILICCALAWEGRIVARNLAPGARAQARILVTGPGNAAAMRSGLADALGRGLAVVSFGLAGGLSPALRSGDLVLPGVVRGEDGRSHRCAPDWLKALRAELDRSRYDGVVEGGVLLGVASPLAGVDEKLRAFRETGACAVDMESHVLAEHSLLPFVSVRAICDEAGMRLGKVAMRSIDRRGRVAPVRLFGALGANPWEIVDLVRLGRARRRARKSLEVAAQALGEVLFRF